jgi:hypothetical protein
VNIHVVVEGEVGEAHVYKHWIPLVNPSLSYVGHVSAIQRDNFAIIAGNGYPHYFEIIDAAVEDVNSLGNINRLVIAVDSEEMSYADKYSELQQHLSNLSCAADIRIVIQHFCLETWALGNRAILSSNRQSRQLREYVNFFNVRINNPELLSGYPRERLNRAQFAGKYLKYALNEKYQNLTYSKNNPKALLHPKYFGHVRDRFVQTGHIPSFEHFLKAFI